MQTVFIKPSESVVSILEANLPYSPDPDEVYLGAFQGHVSSTGEISYESFSEWGLYSSRELAVQELAKCFPDSPAMELIPNPAFPEELTDDSHTWAKVARRRSNAAARFVNPGRVGMDLSTAVTFKQGETLLVVAVLEG